MTYFSRKNILLTLLLISMLLASIWLSHQSYLSLGGDSNNQPSTPDAYMTDVSYTQFDQQGQWRTRLDSPKIVHYAEQDTATLETPQLISRTPDQLTWVITADHGKSQQGLKVINLTDNVKIQRTKDSTKQTTTLTTTAMTAYPEQKFAKTDQPVKIVEPGITMNATGLTADLNTGDINLLSGVQGSYEKSAATP